MSTLADIYSFSDSGFPTYVSPKPPSNPGNQNLWYNPETGELSVWDGSEWVVVSCNCDGCTGGGGTAGAVSFVSWTYEASDGQAIFSGSDIFGATLSGLSAAGTKVLVHVNGVRIQSNEFSVTADGEIALIRGVAAGSSVVVDAIGVSGGGSPYPAPSSFIRCTYAAEEGQTAFSGEDIFGAPLAGLEKDGTLASVHVNGIRIQDNDYLVTADGEITLSRGVAAGSSVIVEAFAVADGGGTGGGSPYPAPGSYIRCTYAATADGQTHFTGTDRFGNKLSGLKAAGSIVIVHVNGVRIEDDEYIIVSDTELALSRGVAFGSSVIIEVMEVAEGSGWGVPPVTPSTAYKIETGRWTFDDVQKTFSIYVQGALYAPESATGVFLSLEGVMLDPEVDFTVSGSLLTFSVAPPADALCWGIIGVPLTAGLPEHNHDCGVF